MRVPVRSELMIEGEGEPGREKDGSGREKDELMRERNGLRERVRELEGEKERLGE